jgi:hypothetical protein
MNPIVSDVRCARPGGALFRRNGVLYRPAQNSDITYGRSIAVMEITELTPDRYAERLAFRIEPDWLPKIYGCHTIALADDVIALDGKALKWRPRNQCSHVIPVHTKVRNLKIWRTFGPEPSDASSCAPALDHRVGKRDNQRICD